MSSPTIVVKANNSTCKLTSTNGKSLQITRTLAAPSFTKTIGSICAHSGNVTTIAPVAGATSYTWTVTNSLSINDESGPSTFTSNNTGIAVYCGHEISGDWAPATLSVHANKFLLVTTKF
jgi:hypothetical protein